MDKTLCCSCVLFLIASVCAYLRQNYVLMTVDFVAFVGSFGHHTTNRLGSTFHKLDLCTSRFAALFHLCLPFVNKLPLNIMTFFIANNITTSYYLSVYAYRLQPTSCVWKLYHVNFHVVVFVAQMYAIFFYRQLC